MSHQHLSCLSIDVFFMDKISFPTPNFTVQLNTVLTNYISILSSYSIVFDHFIKELFFFRSRALDFLCAVLGRRTLRRQPLALPRGRSRYGTVGLHGYGWYGGSGRSTESLAPGSVVLGSLWSVLGNLDHGWCAIIAGTQTWENKDTLSFLTTNSNISQVLMLNSSTCKSKQRLLFHTWF